MKKTIQTLLIIGLIAIPAVALAQGTLGVSSVTTGFTSFKTIIDTFTQTIVRSLATLFATAAMVAFFYGIVRYIWGVREGDQNQIKTGNQFMIWGLVALFVMFSVWGIVNLAQRIFGIQGQNTINIPEIKLQTGGSPSATPTNTALPTGAQGTQNNTTQNNTSITDYNSCMRVNGDRATCSTMYPGGGGNQNPPSTSGTQGNASACASIANPVLQQDCYNNNNTCPAGQAMTAQGCQLVQ